jgi:H+/gluconate symporter-like permease
MTKRLSIRLLALAFVAAFALRMIGCNATVGIGVAVPAYGPWYGPWGGGVYVGGPIWP